MKSQIAALLAQEIRKNDSLKLAARSNSIRATNNQLANEIR